MTKREAIALLIEHAARNCAGVGCGIRALPSAEEKQRVAQAVRKVWPLAYPGQQCTANDLANRSLPPAP
jgi:hypothetical protein